MCLVHVFFFGFACFFVVWSSILGLRMNILTIVAANTNVTSNIKYPILKTTFISYKGTNINKIVSIRTL